MSLVNGQAGNRLLELIHGLRGHLGADQVDRFETLHVLERVETGVSDLGAAQGQYLEVLEPFEARKALIADLRARSGTTSSGSSAP